MSSNSQVAQCLVCGKKKQHGRVAQFFNFPYEIARCKAWVKAIGMRELLFMPLEQLREQVVCVDHFDLESIRYNRLHTTALPSNTPYPSLSDDDIVYFPIRVRNEPGYSVRFPSFCKQEGTIFAPTSISEYTSSVIDYKRPLMESLGTLVHNDEHIVQKPAGILNSIAVPLMTYSSSLEKGTVFAAADPGKAYEMPFVPFIEPTSHNECTTNNRYTNVKGITPSANVNITNIVTVPNIKSTVKEFIKTTEPIHNNTLVGMVKPNIKTVEHASKPKRDYKVSFGLKTLITGNPRKAKKVPNVKTSEGYRQLPIETPEDRYKNIKQYTNSRLTIHSIKRSMPIILNQFTAHPFTATPTASMPEEDKVIKVENTAKDAFHTSQYVTLFSTNSAVPAYSNDNNNDPVATLEPQAESTINDLTFVPYTQYTSTVTVTPESPNAHTAEGTLDYGLPLMNCIGTVFQGNISSTIKTNKAEEVIDVPLMKCFKTLEYTNIL